MKTILEKKITESPLLKINPKVLSEIFCLHKECGNTEWSGILWLDVKGSIINPKDLVLNAIDLTLLDLGEPTFTTFSLDEKLLDIYIEKPELIGKKISIIHTHHNMKAFFSGTDMNNLLEQANCYNYFVSTIVNKDCDIISKISVEGKTENIKKFIKNDKNEFIEIDNKTESETFVYTMDCKVETNYENSAILDKIKKDRKEKLELDSNKFKSIDVSNRKYDFNNFNQTFNERNTQLDLYEDLNNENNISEEAVFICDALNECVDLVFKENDLSDYQLFGIHDMEMLKSIIKQSNKIKKEEFIKSLEYVIDDMLIHDFLDFQDKRKSLNLINSILNEHNFKHTIEFLQILNNNIRKHERNL